LSFEISRNPDHFLGWNGDINEWNSWRELPQEVWNHAFSDLLFPIPEYEKAGERPSNPCVSGTYSVFYGRHTYIYKKLKVVPEALVGANMLPLKM
jgi:hypothetical protein